MSEPTPWRIAPILGVRNVRKAVEYYTNVLGFELPNPIFEGVAEGEGGVYAIVHREAIEIHLQIRRRELFADERESIESDAYLFVADADALYDELKGRGARIVRVIQDEPYGLRDFTIEDLEGHRIVFGTPLT